MDHELPEGFKPVNIESYDGTTDPTVWMARGNTQDLAINWITSQDNQERSMDRGGAPKHMTMTVIPDTLTANPAGPNITSQMQPDCVVT